MFNSVILAMLLMLLSASNTSWAQEQESEQALSKQAIADALNQADQFRSKYDNAKVAIKVSQYEAEQLLTVREFDVYTQSQQRALVIYKSKSELGQKVLMKGNDYWMFLPKSRRPIRITPMQKLLGEAAIGDIATMRWSDDYQVVTHHHNAQGIEMTLQAKHEKVSYQTIKLLVAKENFFPKQAEMFLNSGRLAKTVNFTARGDRVGSMLIRDKVQRNKMTQVEYQDFEAVTLSEKFFNPQMLIRNDLRF
ncbi:outer membrane lipoprotein-sorting protein [Pseudoalteromonas sp. PS5]|uniref:outer membrane lipoprotein-sorting protein n=1 Tax=Pseudoalteromonas sp. PS5 TaxID=1437473 RepID=UPI000FFE6F18|nr:outer membrane lipoprotein-sorting protein [Pseudoalteromonas sp. PS5]RXE94945.1 outer membrane lipoprotein-sorting protein [Pseudoalteromonas sp. PS5]